MQDLEFPSDGNHGPNLLSGEVDTALAADDERYSMRVEKVREVNDVRVVVSCADGCDNQSSYWARRSQTGWSIEDTGPGLTEEWNLVAERADANVLFVGTDTLRLDVFVGDEEIKEVRVPFKPEQ